MLITNIALGEIIFGGVGAGLYSMIYFAIIAVFIAGLMVGRTPEYLGKKIERKEIMMAVLALLVSPAAGSGLYRRCAWRIPQGSAGILNPGPHGLTEVLYAYTSGQRQQRLGLRRTLQLSLLQLDDGHRDADRPLRRGHPHPGLWRLAGRQTGGARWAGDVPDDGILFVALLIGVILIVGALTYFPAYSLGPIVEHLLMYAGRTF